MPCAKTQEGWRGYLVGWLVEGLMPIMAFCLITASIWLRACKKVASDLELGGGFTWVLQCPPLSKLASHSLLTGMCQKRTPYTILISPHNKDTRKKIIRCSYLPPIMTNTKTDEIASVISCDKIFFPTKLISYPWLRCYTGKKAIHLILILPIYHLNLFTSESYKWFGIILVE